MYTFNRVISDNKDVTRQRRIVNVEFIDGTNLFSKEMQFRLSETNDAVKRAFKQYLDEVLNAPETDDIADLTYTETTPEAPTKAELDRQAWNEDRQKLATLMELVRDGVFTGNETQIANLQAKIKTGFKVDYLG